jgi:pimeloyl-ACP methyl ester carboxylesterase
LVLPHDGAGSGPAVLLLHAGIADRTMWREQLEPLARAGYRALALDLPGFGAAPLAEGPQAPWTDVIETMDSLHVERAALVGNSYGGAAWDAESAALERGDIEAAVQAVVAAWTRPDAPVALRERLAAMQRLAFATQLAAGDQGEAPDPLEQDPQALTRLRTPALVAVGGHDMPDFLEAAEMLAQTLVNARHEVIEHAGHLAPLETPQDFTRLLLAFLGEQDA